MGRKPEIIGDKLKDKIINEIWTFFETKKKERKNKKHNVRKNIIIWDIGTFFEKKERKRTKMKT